MRALVVYESMYGNTKKVAEAIAAGLATAYDVTTRPADEETARLAADVDLIVVGGPTHAHGMSSRTTRQSGADGVPKASLSDGTGVGRGVREWLAHVSPPKGVVAATFDTRVKGPGILVGSAGRAIGRRLASLGCRLVGKAESFTVRGQLGPLLDGELDRAEAFGKQLAERTVT